VFQNAFLTTIFRLLLPYTRQAGRKAQSVKQLPTTCTARGPESREGEILRTRQGRPWPPPHPASCTMVIGSLSGLKRPARGVDEPPPSSAEVKETVGQYLYSPPGLRGLLQNGVQLVTFYKKNLLFGPIIVLNIKCNTQFNTSLRITRSKTINTFTAFV